MNQKLTIIVIVSTMMALFFTLTSAQNPQTAPVPDPAQVKRGEYLATFGGCHDCHTPKKMTPKGPEVDMTRALAGHPSEAKLAEIPAGLSPDKWMTAANVHLSAWAGPWGVSFAANLTPDVETGMGSWSEEMFMKAMRTGKHMGEGREILPPMPWQTIALATDEDLKAIFAYLRSIKPIKNAVPDPIPPATAQ